MSGPRPDDGGLLRAVADRLERLAARSTPGDWRAGGLLASRPEVIAHAADCGSEHVAEARANTAAWIVALSPSVAGPLAAWLRAEAEAPSGGADHARRLAAVLDARLPGQ